MTILLHVRVCLCGCVLASDSSGGCCKVVVWTPHQQECCMCCVVWMLVGLAGVCWGLFWTGQREGGKGTGVFHPLSQGSRRGVAVHSS
jgi:hypothetical protein